MVRVRKLVQAIAAASALTSGMAHALGLGEITLKSALNQPLEAEIELLEVKDLGSNEVMPALAAIEEFNRVGIDRPHFLSDLKFTPVVNARGKSVIQITSSRPVQEPYLNFLVEVLWPSGRLLREYTVLLDPPIYSPQTASAALPSLPVTAAVPSRGVTAPAPAPISAPRPSVSAPPAPVVAAAPTPRTAAPAPAPRPQPAPAAAPVAPRAAAPAPVRQSRDRHQVQASETLWTIAASARPTSSVSIHQTMLAIQALNPDAFINGNINLVKKGAVLRLPTEAQIRERSRAEALADVQAQNEVWRQGRMAPASPSGNRQLDATRRTAAAAAPSTAPEGDALKLVSASAGQSASGSDKGGSGKSAELANKLAVAEESLATATRENQELRDRLNDLQSQLDKLQRILELKNTQLAELTSQVQAGKEPAASSAAAVPAAAAPAARAVAEARPAVEVTAPAADDRPAAAAPAEVAKPAETAKPAEAAKPAAKPAEPKPAEAKPVPPPKPPKPAPYYEPSLVDQILGNPMLLAAGGGTLALLLGLGLMVNHRRKAMKAEQAEQEDDSIDAGELAAGFGAADDSEGVDLLATVEEYAAYGRYADAAALLNRAIAAEPQRADLRLKLMEICGELGDADAFLAQEEALDSMGGQQARIDQLRARYRELFASSQPAVSPVVPAAAATAAVAATGLVAAHVAASPAVEPLLDEEVSLDDLGLDDVPAAPAAVVETPEEEEEDFMSVPELDDVEMSLDDLEAEFERDLAAGIATADVDADDDLLSLGEAGLGDDLTVTPSSMSDIGMSLDLDAEPDMTPDAADDLDFDLDALNDTAASGQEEEDLLADLDGLGADLPELDAAAGDADLLAGFDDLDDLGMDLGEVAAPAAEAAAATSFEDELMSLDDLGLGDLDDLELGPVAAEAPAAPAAAAEDDLLDLGDLDLGEFSLPEAGSPAAEDDLQDLADFDLGLGGSPAAGAADAGLDLDLGLPDLGDDLLAPAASAAIEDDLGLGDLGGDLDDFNLFDEPGAAGGSDDDFGLMSGAGGDQMGTMLDLARAYVEMGDGEGAREILDEVIQTGTPEQQQRARELLSEIG